MMRQETEVKSATLKTIVGNNVFSEDETQGIITIRTLKKYGLIETIRIVHRDEYTLEEIVNELNSMIGQDCYGYPDGEYIIDNGKVYFETVSYAYRFIQQK